MVRVEATSVSGLLTHFEHLKLLILGNVYSDLLVFITLNPTRSHLKRIREQYGEICHALVRKYVSISGAIWKQTFGYPKINSVASIFLETST